MQTRLATPDVRTPGLVTTPADGRPGVLLKVAQAVAAHADLSALLRDLAAALRDHLRVGYLGLALLDPDSHAGKLQFIQPVGGVAPPDPADTPTELPAAESPTAYVWETQEPLWLDVERAQNGKFPVLRSVFSKQGVRTACFIPLTTPRRKLGAMAFNSYQSLAPAPGDVDFALQIGRLVALAVEGALTRQELEQANDRLTQERDRLELLHEVGQAVAARLDMPGLLRAVTAGLRNLVKLRFATLFLPDLDGKHLRAPAADFAGEDPHITDDAVPIHDSPPGDAFRTGRTVRLGPSEMGRLLSAKARWAAEHGGRSFCAVPLQCGGTVVGVLALVGRTPDAFPDDLVELLEAVARPVAVAVANAQAYRRIEELTARLAAEKTYLEEEIRTEWGMDEVVGGSPVLREVLRQVEVVAPTDSAVMITGETGTGKEIIARAVHRHSRRRDRTFVKLNCAAIPTGLLESELFGHEKGAFTGAVERRVGRFELANGGTLFLDEVGDIPPELQPKLLRVLQEQEFERLGSGKTIKVDVRLVAATHRNLAGMVAEGRFRADLYYRLHVFPIRLPALRDRRDDIPGLVRHFVRMFARRSGKVIDQIPAESMAALERYPWPGNVRELEHLIERAVILSPGPELRLPLADLTTDMPPLPPSSTDTVPVRGPLREAERELIRKSLDDCGWVIGGPNGAAIRLGLKRTTLLSRMKKLGLVRTQIVSKN